MMKKARRANTLRSVSLAALVVVLAIAAAAAPAVTPTVARAAAAEADGDTLYQVSIIDALLQGEYDGVTSFEALSRYGDFGLGTIDRLDGEMVADRGRFFQVRVDGRPYPIPDDATTPFAAVTFFEADRTYKIRNVDSWDALTKRIDPLLESGNYPYALRITGVFEHVTVRSVPPQTKPYPKLADVVENQAVFELEQVEGSLIGFWLPDYLQGVNVPGYHLHFLTQDRTAGGHVLDVSVQDGTVELDRLTRIEVKLPNSDSFEELKLQPAEGELDKVERGADSDQAPADSVYESPDGDQDTAGAASETAGTDAEIVVGVLMDQSGSRKLRDEAKAAALRVGAEEINRFLSEVASPYRVRLVFADTSSKPEAALEGLKQLADRGIRVVIGPNSSAEVEEVRALAERRGVLLISTGSTAPSLAVPGDNVYRFVMDDTHQAQALARLMWNDGVRVVVPFARRDVYADNLLWHLKAEFESFGGKVLAAGDPWDTGSSDAYLNQEVRYSPETTNFISELETLAAVVNEQIWQYGPDAVAVQLVSFDEVARIFSEAGNWPVLSSVRWYGTDGTASNQAILRALESAAFAARTRFVAPMLGRVPEAGDEYARLATRVKALDGIELNTTGAAAYDALWVVTQAWITAADRSDPAVLAKALEQAARWHFGASGWTALNSAGDRKLGSYDFWVVEKHLGGYRWNSVGRYRLVPGSPPQLTFEDGWM